MTVTAIDTKNTTGTSNSTSRLYLAGGTSQSPDGVQTYSNVNVYTQNGQLYATRMNATNGFYETSDARLKNFKDDIKALDVEYEQIRNGDRLSVPNTKAATELIIRNPQLFNDYEITKGKMDDVFLAVTGKTLVGGVEK